MLRSAAGEAASTPRHTLPSEPSCQPLLNWLVIPIAGPPICSINVNRGFWSLSISGGRYNILLSAIRSPISRPVMSTSPPYTGSAIHFLFITSQLSSSSSLRSISYMIPSSPNNGMPDAPAISPVVIRKFAACARAIFRVSSASWYASSEG